MIHDDELQNILERMESSDVPKLVEEILRSRRIGWVGRMLAYFAFFGGSVLILSMAMAVIAVSVRLFYFCFLGI